MAVDLDVGGREYVRGDMWAIGTANYLDVGGAEVEFNIRGEQCPQLLPPNELIIDGVSYRYVDTAGSTPTVSTRIRTFGEPTTHYLTDRTVSALTTHQHHAPLGIGLFLTPGETFIQILLSGAGAFNVLTVSAWGRLIRPPEPQEVDVRSVRIWPKKPSKEPI